MTQKLTIQKNTTQKITANTMLSNNNAKIILLWLLTGLAVILSLMMVLPFLASVVWALALAVLFTPLQIWLKKKLKYNGLAALVAVFIISSLVIVPALFVGQQLAMQVASGAQLIQSKVESGEWRRVINAQPTLIPIVKKIEQQVNLPETVKSFTLMVSDSVGYLIKGSIFQIVSFILTIYLLFFFLRDALLIKQNIVELLPLSNSQSQQLLLRINDTIHAIVYGTLAIAAVQGLLGGLMFWVLGLPAPMLWGVIMSFLAVIPMLGTAVIWLPAAIFLMLNGQWTQAIILLLWGTLVIGTVDNLLRPMLVGNRLKQHTLLIFLSLVGGLILFGSSGLILGPIVLASALFLIAAQTELIVNE